MKAGRTQRLEYEQINPTGNAGKVTKVFDQQR